MRLCAGRSLSVAILVIINAPSSVTVRFGIGLFRNRIRIKDILSARPVRNKWWYGWGIRVGTWGWM